ncbi:MAG: sugar transferase [Bacteroidetes bacterium]|nr:sugar transferase [Bacteroidota bacterium]
MDIFGVLIRLKIIPLLKKGNLLYIIIGALDLFSIIFAYQISYFFNCSCLKLFIFSGKEIILHFLLIIPVWVLILCVIKITEIPRTKKFRVLFYEYLLSAVVVFAFQVLLLFIPKVDKLSISFVLLFTILGFVFLFTVRFLEYNVLQFYRSKGFNYVNLVLIADDSSIPLIKKLLSTKEWGYRVVLIFSSSRQLMERYGSSIKILPEKTLVALHDILEVYMIDEVMYIKDKANQVEVRKTIRSCEELGVVFRLLHTQSRHVITNAILSTIANTRFLTFINTPNNSLALVIKKIIDIYISAIMIILFTPFFALVGILIKLNSKGPVIYKQTRVGLRGRQFYLYKFRTMTVNADHLLKDIESQNEADGPVFKIQNDFRVTKVGKFLRKTGLDELPQLFNILKGEMSLIGPRPPILSETKQYKKWQLRRLSVKPGLSCFWQVKDNRHNIEFEKWMELDLAYIDNWSLRLDLLIFFRTFGTVLKRTGA